MKVLFDPQIFNLQIFGGISLYFTKLLEYYSKDSEIEFKLPLTYSDNRYICTSSLLKNLSFYEYNFLFKDEIVKILKRFNALKFYIKLKSKKFDLLHPTYFDKSILKHIGNKQFVLTIHDMTQEMVPEYFVFDKKVEEFKETKKILAQKAARIIAISENTKKDIINLYNIEENKIDIIYHALPLKITDKESPDQELPEKFILFVGQRAKYKNFALFLQSISDILKNDKNLKLACAGGPDFNKSEKKFIKNLGIEGKVIRLPITYDEHLINYYKNALCFVFPSIYEGFGFPILEAFQCGCPLVCSNTSSFPEVAGDGAVYFDPYDTESIKSAVVKVIQDKSLSKNIVQKGYDRLKDFSWQKTTELTKKTYRKVLADG